MNRSNLSWKVCRWVSAVLIPIFIVCPLAQGVLTVYADEPSSQSGSKEEIQTPSIVSESGVIMEVETGQILFQKNKDKQMQPASITKIVTAIVALESGISLDEKITVSQNAVNSVPRSSTHIALDVGETLPLRDALYALMLQSANDAAVCIAEHVAGTTEQFVEKMNDLAKKVGAVNTHFTNPHGLIDHNHYTSAGDMALLTQYALQNAQFTEIFSTITYEAEPTNKQPEKRIWSNQNDMIKNTTYKYEGAFGGKLGYTEEALYTIVTAAKRNGRTLICVCMKSDPYVQQYQDASALLDFGFDEFKKVEMTAEDLPFRNITFAVKVDEKVKIPASAQILTGSRSVYYLPKGLKKDDYEISFNYTEKENILEGFAPIATVTLKNVGSGIPSVIQVPLEANITDAVLENSSSEPPEEEGAFWESTKKVLGVIWSILKWVLLVLLILVVLLMLLRMWFVYQAKQKKKARMERERRRKAMMRQRDQQMQAYMRKEELRRQMRNSSKGPSSRPGSRTQR